MPSLPHPHKHHKEKKLNDDPNLDSKDGTNDIEKLNTNYKEKLDEVAHKVREHEHNNGNGNGNGSGSGSYTDAAIETVSQYVPAVGRMLGKDDAEEPAAPQNNTSIPGPPERPDHDTQIEEFVRDQHRSKKGDGLE